MALRILTLIFLSLNSSTSLAKDFGAHGPLFLIDEPNLLEVIHQKIADFTKSGDLLKLKNNMQDRTRTYVNTPTPVLGITKATKNHTYNVDLSITTNTDLYDHNGKIFSKKGQVINPLDYSRFNKEIIIFDGDDTNQVNYAIGRGNELNTLLILVKGSPIELTKTYGRRFYFDQGGTIADRFSISKVPSTISRSYPYMKVTEVYIDGEFQ